MTNDEAIYWLAEMQRNCRTGTNYNDKHRSEKDDALSMAMCALKEWKDDCNNDRR